MRLFGQCVFGHRDVEQGIAPEAYRLLIAAGASQTDMNEVRHDLVCRDCFRVDLRSIRDAVAIATRLNRMKAALQAARSGITGDRAEKGRLALADKSQVVTELFGKGRAR